MIVSFKLFNDIKNKKWLQVNNRRLALSFAAGKSYNTKLRGVEITTDSRTGEQTVYARLYRTNIAKLEKGELYVTYGGWPTSTTTKAINACLPAGWKYQRRQLITPNGRVIDVTPNWTLVKEVPLKYELIEETADDSLHF